MHKPTKKHEGNNRISLSQVKTKATHLVGDLFVQRAAVVRRVTFSTQNGTVWKPRVELQSIYMTSRLRRQAGAKRTAQFTALSNVHMLLRFPIPTIHSTSTQVVTGISAKIHRFISCIGCKSSEALIPTCRNTSQDDRITQVWRICESHIRAKLWRLSCEYALGIWLNPFVKRSRVTRLYSLVSVNSPQIRKKILWKKH